MRGRVRGRSGHGREESACSKKIARVGVSISSPGDSGRGGVTGGGGRLCLLSFVVVCEAGEIGTGGSLLLSFLEYDGGSGAQVTVRGLR